MARKRGNGAEDATEELTSIHVQIPKSLARKLRIKAAEEETSIGGLTRRLLRESWDERYEKKKGK